MPNYTTTTTITTGRGESLTASKSGQYNEVFNIRQEVDNSTAFIPLLSASGTKGSATLEDCKSIIIKNDSDTGAEIQIHTQEWADDTPDTNAGAESYQLYLLGAGEFLFLPNFRQFNFITAATSGGDAYQLTNQVPDANMYTDSTANVDSATANGIVSSNSSTTIYLEPYTSATNCTANLFRVGDIIRVDDEIMEVTAIGDKSNLANNTLTVIRGANGSTKATAAADTDPVRFAFFNAFNNFTAATGGFDKIQTDAMGRFKATNFFGYGRTLTNSEDGLVAGSISGKFYKAGYQELGLSGISPATKTGLTASTVYYFKIAVDGGTALELSITTDGTNQTFHQGSNSLLSKIQTALGEQYYTAGHLFELRVTVGIVGGDIRFTSGQHLSTSAIALSAGTSGADTTTEFFAQAIGRIPIAAKLEGSVAARLPEDTITDTKSGLSIANKSELFYDDGHGNILGKCSGSINYSSGAITLLNAPPNAEFVVDANYGSAHSGGNNYAEGTANCIRTISGRSTNSKINSTIEIIGLK